MTNGGHSPGPDGPGQEQIIGREITLRDVARLAGVHPSTASRALDPQTARHVNQATAQRIQDIAAALGYRPNPLAQGLRTRRSHSVGLLVSMESAHRMFEVAHAVEDELSKVGYSLLLATSNNDPEMHGRKLTALVARHVEGLLLVGPLSEPSTSNLPNVEVPTVWLGGRARAVAGTEGPATVTVDESAGIMQILNHLMELGHRCISYVSPPTWSGGMTERLTAFTNVVTECGLDPRACPALVCSGSTGGDGYLAARSIMAEHDVTAIVVGGEALAIGCLKALQEEGRDCPGDVSLVGYDDLSLNDYLRPSLTAVRVPFATMGTEAAKLLIGLIGNASTPARSFIAHPELVIRASTAPAPRSGR